MEVSLIGTNALKIKGKIASLLINPIAVKSKTAADGIILLSRGIDYDASKIEGSRVVLQGAGEYEVSGVKITATAAEKNLIYNLHIDGLSMIVANAEALEKVKEKLNEHNLVLVNANSAIDQSIITSLNPRVVVIYGEKAEEFLKALGREVKPVAKFATTLEKLPAETETVILA